MMGVSGLGAKPIRVIMIFMLDFLILSISEEKRRNWLKMNTGEGGGVVKAVGDRLVVLSYTS